MASQSFDDCYFYYYSSCTKGDECPYRHCKLALGTETVCSLWREGRCFRSNCKFRHMESQINRSAIPCYWENQPGGCRKPHCVFLHRKLRNGVPSDPRMIMPILNGKSSPIVSDPKDQNSLVMTKSPSSPEVLTKDLISDPASVPVPRLVLSFDEGEESDTESVSSTPVKVPSEDCKSLENDSAKRNINSKFAAKIEEKDFGIKTLEQIRMEKIHKESNHYYSDEAPDSLGVSRNPCLITESNFRYSGYDAPSLESPHLLEQHTTEYYPPQTEFISLQSSAQLDKTLPVPNKDTTRQNLELESDLRSRLFKRVNQKTVVDKPVVNYKPPQKKKPEESPKDLNFKIKTLDEIRRERESKRGIENDSANSIFDPKASTEENKPELHSDSQKLTKRLKITRRSQELYAKAAASLTNESEVPVKNTTQEKRKTEDSEVNRSSKFLKVDSSELVILNGSLKQVEKKDKKHVKSLGSFLRRSRAKVSPHLNIPSATSMPDANIDKQNDLTSLSHLGNPTLSNSEPESPTDVPSSSLNAPFNNDQDNKDMLSSMDYDESLSTSGDNVVKASSTKEALGMNDPEKVKVNDLGLERSVSVDEFDSFLNETDMSVDDNADSAYGDDILLEVEQFLDS